MKTKWIFSSIFFLFIQQGIFLPPLSFAHLLKVGTISIQPDEKLLVLGIFDKSALHHPIIDLQKLGFDGDQIHQIDPKFLIEMKAGQIVRVRSFELQVSKKSELPPTLLKVQTAKAQEVAHFLGNQTESIGKSLGFPIGTASVLARLKSHSREKLKKLQAYYLLEIIDKTLPPNDLYPELRNAIGNDTELSKLGEKLLTRYHPKSNWAGLHVPEDRDGNFYERWRLFQAGIRTKNRGFLVRMANELGLKLLIVGNEFAYVFAQPSTFSYLEKISKDFYFHHWIKPITPDSDQVSQGAIIPWKLVSLIHPKGLIELGDFLSPGLVGTQMKNQAKATLSLNIAGSFLPLSHLILNGIHHQIESKKVKNGNTQPLNKLESFGSLLALTETQGIEINDPAELQLEAYPGLALLNQNSSTSLYEAAFHLGNQEARKGQIFPKESIQEIWQKKVFRWSQVETYIQRKTSPKKTLSRGPASISSQKKPVILILIDGLRPDQFERAAQEGLIPNLKSLFIDRGTQIESYATRSLTLPSWSTILTGFENDMNGVRSNTPTSRSKHKMLDNYLNPIKDLLSARNLRKNRAFRRLEENQVGEIGKTWLAGYFSRSESIYNYIPVVRNPHFGIKYLFQEFFRQKNEFYNGIWDPATTLDVSSATATAAKIRADKRGKLRFVMNWYGSVDEAQHYNNQLLPMIYQDLDHAIGNVLNAAKDHPVLKDATVFLVSDHGHTGGFGPSAQDPILIHTGFNLTRFFAGEVQGWENYSFNVGTPHSHSHKNNLFAIPNPSIHGKKDVYPKSKLKANLLVDYSGDNMAQVYLKGSKEWKSRHNYFELTHFLDESKNRINLPKDLLTVQVENLAVQDQKLAKRIHTLSHQNPTELFAMALPDPEGIQFAKDLDFDPSPQMSLREPVLLIKRNPRTDTLRFGLILTRSDRDGNDQFQYLVLENFNQNQQGQYQGTISEDPDQDPLGYLNTVAESHELQRWKSDREWIQLTRLHSKPTAVFALPRILTLSSRFTDPRQTQIHSDIKALRESETPDFILFASPGYAYHSHTPMESDHGGLAKEEVRNSFYVSSLNLERFKKHEVKLNFPIFTRDVTPTVLNYAGLGEPGQEPIPATQGMSFKPLLDEGETHTTHNSLSLNH